MGRERNVKHLRRVAEETKHKRKKGNQVQGEDWEKNNWSSVAADTGVGRE